MGRWEEDRLSQRLNTLTGTLVTPEIQRSLQQLEELLVTLRQINGPADAAWLATAVQFEQQNSRYLNDETVPEPIRVFLGDVIAELQRIRSESIPARRALPAPEREPQNPAPMQAEPDDYYRQPPSPEPQNPAPMQAELDDYYTQPPAPASEPPRQNKKRPPPEGVEQPPEKKIDDTVIPHPLPEEPFNPGPISDYQQGIVTPAPRPSLEDRYYDYITAPRDNLPPEVKQPEPRNPASRHGREEENPEDESSGKRRIIRPPSPVPPFNPGDVGDYQQGTVTPAPRPSIEDRYYDYITAPRDNLPPEGKQPEPRNPASRHGREEENPEDGSSGKRRIIRPPSPVPPFNPGDVGDYQQGTVTPAPRPSIEDRYYDYITAPTDGSAGGNTPSTFTPGRQSRSRAQVTKRAGPKGSRNAAELQQETILSRASGAN